MGLFSSSSRIFVASHASPLNIGDETPEVTTVMENILDVESRRTHTEAILKNHLAGLSTKLNRVYSYGEATYTHGLPNGTMEVGRGNDNAVAAVLATLEGSAVEIVSNVLDDYNPDFVGEEWLVTNRAYNVSTSIVGSPPQARSEDTYLYSIDLLNPTTIQITYKWIQHVVEDLGEGATQDHYFSRFYTENVTVPAVNSNSVYYLVRYFTVDGIGNPTSGEKIWVYEEASGLYPTLDLADGTSFASPFYPIVPLRWDNVDKTDPALAGTPLWDTSNRLLKKINLDLVDLGTMINENPDVGDIDHAFLFFGVNLHTEKADSIHYLTQFFLYLESISSFTKADYLAWNTGTKDAPPPVNTLNIADAGLKLQVHYNYIDSTVINGSIGKIGTATRTDNIQPLFTKSETYTQGDEDKTRVLYDAEMSSVTFRQQLTDSTYIEVEVKGLLHVNHVYGTHTVETTIAMSADPDDDNFVLPLNKFVLKQLSLQKENAVIQDSIKVIFNSYEKVKVKWYQSFFFRALLTIAAIVMSAYGAYQAGVALLEAGTAIAVLVTLVKIVAISIAMKYAVDLVVTILGLEDSFWAAVVAFVAAAIVYNQTGTFKGEGWATAENMMWAVSQLNQGVQRGVEEELDALKNESVAFTEESEGKMKNLEELFEELEGSDILNPLLFTSLSVNFNPDEEPEEFYNRTQHIGNPGVLSLDVIENFVSTKLSLPDAKPSYAGELYGEATI